MISPLPGVIPTKPGSATLPFFGIVPQVVDDTGKPVPKNCSGRLVISKPWPGMARGIWGDFGRYQKAYWSEVPEVILPAMAVDGIKTDIFGSGAY